MKTRYRILCFIALFQLLSCDDFVDIQPRGFAIPSSLRDVDLLLNNASLITQGTNQISSLLNDNIQLTNEELDFLNSTRGTSVTPNIYNLEPIFFGPDQADLTWNLNYQQIGLANFALQTLEEIDTDDPLKLVYEADARMNRAYNYFVLVNTYGPHYGLPEAAVAESGVPILMRFADESVALVRSSVNEVYEFIIEDLEVAIASLPNSVFTSNRPNRAAALGLMAEVRLHTGDYEEALSLALEALETNNTLIDYEETQNTGFGRLPQLIRNPENFWAKAEMVQLVDGGGFNTNGISLTAYSQALLDIIDRDNDLRFVYLIQDPVTNNFVYEENFNFAIGVTVPEVMLIAAECYARTGDIINALTLVNRLRSFRFSNDFVNAGNHILSANDSNTAIQVVLDERRREFNTNGHRFYTIKRLNAIENGNISLARQSDTYTPNSINWAVPIPQNVVQTSEGQIKQNARE